ncbi:MAG: hypothetical protein QOK03_658 [Candidatus Binataceae bacterium]|nr:hypothetical protein [Candidatus Binataceae bacterium]
MVNPIEQIGKSRRRLARLAATRAAIWVTLPLIVTVLFFAGLDIVAALTWENFGYILTDAREWMVGNVLIGAVLAELLALGILALLAYRRADDFLKTAEILDDHVNGHQEIITLATLADPANPQGRERRSPLFPMLWRRAIAYLDLFEPRHEFKLDAIEPLKRSAIVAGAVAVVLGLSAFGFALVPTPDQAIAHKLRAVARAIERSSATPADRDLATAMRDVARDLENPKLPAEQKLQELAAMKRELEKIEQQHQSGSSLAKNSSGGSGGGSGSGNSKGTGNGSGSGSGEGNGSGQGRGSGAGQGAGAGGGGKGGKSDQKMVELGNDIAKAQAQIEAENGPRDQSKGQQQADNGSGAAPKEGNNPNASSPRNAGNGPGNAELPKPGSEARNNLPAPAGGTPSGRRDDKGSMGDTHLGEMPKAGNYERFYKAGEGPPLEIHDARYVTFRLPSTAIGNAGAGRTVADAEHPGASVGYTNAPLKQERLADTPDERQLVPPRYRDLIH